MIWLLLSVSLCFVVDVPDVMVGWTGTDELLTFVLTDDGAVMLRRDDHRQVAVYGPDAATLPFASEFASQLRWKVNERQAWLVTVSEVVPKQFNFAVMRWKIDEHRDTEKKPVPQGDDNLRPHQVCDAWPLQITTMRAIATGNAMPCFDLAIRGDQLLTIYVLADGKIVEYENAAIGEASKPGLWQKKKVFSVDWHEPFWLISHSEQQFLVTSSGRLFAVPDSDASTLQQLWPKLPPISGVLYSSSEAPQLFGEDFFLVLKKNQQSWQWEAVRELSVNASALKKLYDTSF